MSPSTSINPTSKLIETEPIRPLHLSEDHVVIVVSSPHRWSLNLGSNPSEYQIFHLFRSVLSSLLHLRSVGRSNFDKGLHNLITLIQKTT